MSLIGKKFLAVANRTKAFSKRGKTDFKAFEHAKSIGILYTWKDAQKENFIHDFRASLGADKNVRFLCYNPEKKNTVNTENPVFTLSELSVLGQINSDQANSFQQESFDYLFHLDFILNEITKSVVLGSKAHWKVGSYSNEGEALFDLMIKLNESAGLYHLAEQMLFYVKALK